MELEAWGQLIAPGVWHQVDKAWPQVFDVLKIAFNLENETVIFAFRIAEDQTWIKIPISKEVILDSPNPTEQIMAIILGNFTKLLKPGLKAAMHAWHYSASPQTFAKATAKKKDVPFINGVEAPWSLSVIDYYLELHFPDYHFITGIIFSDVVKIKAHFGSKSWDWQFTLKWLDNAGVSLFLFHISKKLGLYYKPKEDEKLHKNQATYQAEYHSGFVVTQQMIEDAAYGTATSMLAMLDEMHSKMKHADRYGQFYEQDGMWIPVGLTLADIT